MSDSEVHHDHSVDRAYDYYDCDPAVLAEEDIGRLLSQDAADAGFTVLGVPQFHRFAGGGFSQILLFAESHGAIHGSPEKGHCLEVTIHSCYVLGLSDKQKTPDEKAADLHRLWSARLRPERIVTYPERRRATRGSRDFHHLYEEAEAVIPMQGRRARKQARG